MEVKSNMCSQCVNWLELSKDLATCDYDNFVDIPVDKAELFLDVLFDCQEFEKLKD